MFYNVLSSSKYPSASVMCEMARCEQCIGPFSVHVDSLSCMCALVTQCIHKVIRNIIPKPPQITSHFKKIKDCP